MAFGPWKRMYMVDEPTPHLPLQAASSVSLISDKEPPQRVELQAYRAKGPNQSIEM